MLREPWRTRLLFLSFAVNLVTIPALASRYLHLTQPPALPMGGAPALPVVVEHMAQKLSAEDAEKLRAAVEPHIEDIQVARARMDAARRDMIRILGEKEFDRDAARSAMTRWQNQWHAWSRSFGEAMLDAFGQISPDGRQHLAERPNRPRS